MEIWSTTVHAHALPNLSTLCTGLSNQNSIPPPAFDVDKADRQSKKHGCMRATRVWCFAILLVKNGTKSV